jgi:predicted amidohydrolase
MERTIFGDSSGDSLHNVVDVPEIGKVGALACWEHMQPLLKYHTHSQREEIHVAAWPALDPYVENGGGNWGMSREGCTALSQIYALEGGAFVLHASGVILQDGIDLMGTSQGPIYNTPGGGCAAIFGPDGCRLTEPLPPTQEGLVFADFDKRRILATRMLLDTCGHYSRPDMLWLGVDSRARKHVQYAHHGCQDQGTRDKI